MMTVWEKFYDEGVNRLNLIIFLALFDKLPEGEYEGLQVFRLLAP